MRFFTLDQSLKYQTSVVSIFLNSICTHLTISDRDLSTFPYLYFPNIKSNKYLLNIYFVLCIVSNLQRINVCRSVVYKYSSSNAGWTQDLGYGRQVFHHIPHFPAVPFYPRDSASMNFISNKVPVTNFPWILRCYSGFASLSYQHDQPVITTIGPGRGCLNGQEQKKPRASTQRTDSQLASVRHLILVGGTKGI